MISEHVIYTYFAAAHDWTLAPGSLRTGWQAVYKGPLYDYHVHFDVDEEWVYLQCPLLMMEVLPQCKLALYEYMLRANNDMFLAKFTLVRGPEEGPRVEWIALTSECPVDSFNASVFRLMIESIATYAAQHDREIQAIGLNPEVAAMLGDI